jgi:hypothetical protein
MERDVKIFFAGIFLVIQTTHSAQTIAPTFYNNFAPYLG